MHTQTDAMGAAARFDRRRLLGGLAAAGGLAALPSLAGCSGGDSKGTSLGSNYSDQVPQKALAKVLDAFEKEAGISVDINTQDHEQYQQQISSYLQGNPQEVFSWFAGYRMQFFAERGFASPLPKVWSSIGDGYTDAFKQSSTFDGKQYFVPFYYYPWAVFYRRSVFESKGYEIPKTLEDMVALCKEMESDGLIPFAFADKEGWPAMGMFDVLNFRINGYDFHMRLMQGEESWDSDQVKEVFATWASLMPYHQKGALGLDWIDSAAKLVNKKAGMYYLGMFIGQAFTNKSDHEDLDFFPFPEVNPKFGQKTIDAPIDGWMMSKGVDDTKNARELLTFLGSPKGQEIYLKADPNNVAANQNADTSNYNHLQKKAVELVGAAENIAQFMDRDTRPDFAQTVMIPSIQTFIKNPSKINQLTKSIQRQKVSIFGD